MKSSKKKLFLSSMALLSILFVGCSGVTSSSGSETSSSEASSSSEQSSSSSSSSSSTDNTKENIAILREKVNQDADKNLTSLSAYQTVYDTFTLGIYGGVYSNIEGNTGVYFCYTQDSVTSTELSYKVYDNDVMKYNSKSYQESVYYNLVHNEEFPEEKLISNYEMTEFYDDDNKMFLTMEDKYNTKNSISDTTKYRKDSLVGQGYRSFKSQADYVLSQGNISIPSLNTQFVSYVENYYKTASSYELSVTIDGKGEVGDIVEVKLKTVEETSLYDLYPNIGNYYSSQIYDAKIDIETVIEASFDITENGYEISYMTVDSAYHVMQDPYIGASMNYTHCGEDISSKGFYLQETEVLYETVGYGELGKDGEKTKVTADANVTEKLSKVSALKETASTIDATATKGESVTTTNHYLIDAMYHGEDVAFEETYGHPMTDYRGSKTLTSSSTHYADGYVVTNANEKRDHYNFAGVTDATTGKTSYSLNNGTVASEEFNYTTVLNKDASGNVIANMTSEDKESLNLKDQTLYSSTTLANNGYTADSYLATVVGCNGLLYNYLNTYYVNMPNSDVTFTDGEDNTTTVTMTSSYYSTYSISAEALEDTETDYYDSFINDMLCQVKINLTAVLDSEGRVISFETTRTYYALENYKGTRYSEPLEFGKIHFTEAVSYDAVGNYKTTETTNA